MPKFRNFANDIKKHKNMTTIAANNTPTDISIARSYWRTLSMLSDSVKLRLASMLTASIVEKADKRESSAELTQRMLKKYSGVWVGDESPKEIIAAIHENSSIRNAVQL